MNYAANQGCEWVVLTNGIECKLFRVCFKKPIDKQEIAAFNLLTTSVKKDDDLEKIFLRTKEGFTKSAVRPNQHRIPFLNPCRVSGTKLLEFVSSSQSFRIASPAPVVAR